GIAHDIEHFIARGLVGRAAQALKIQAVDDLAMQVTLDLLIRRSFMGCGQHFLFSSSKATRRSWPEPVRAASAARPALQTSVRYRNGSHGIPELLARSN